MNPWFFLGAAAHHAFGGSVAQRIEPDTTWFFNGIAPTAGILGSSARPSTWPPMGASWD